MSMAETAAIGAPKVNSTANWALKGSAGFWFLAAFTGQWSFLYYIAAFYGPSTLQGNFAAWNKGKSGFFFRGYVPGAATAPLLLIGGIGLLLALREERRSAAVS